MFGYIYIYTLIGGSYYLLLFGVDRYIYIYTYISRVQGP